MRISDWSSDVCASDLNLAYLVCRYCVVSIEYQGVSMSRQAFICDAIRTPFGRYGGALSSVRADDLAAVPLRALVERNPGRSEERRVGKECVSPCRYRWWPYH